MDKPIDLKYPDWENDKRYSKKEKEFLKRLLKGYNPNRVNNIRSIILSREVEDIIYSKPENEYVGERIGDEFEE